MKLAGSLAILLLMGSCISDITDTVEKAQKIDAIKWNPTIAVPLVYSRLKLDDLFGVVNTNQYLRIESDGGLSLVYADDFVSDNAEDVLALVNKRFDETFTLSTDQRAALQMSGSVTIKHDRVLAYNFAGNELDRLLLKKGTFNLAVSSTLEHDVSCTLKFLHATMGSSVFEPTVTAVSNTLPNAGNTSLNLDGLEIDFTQTTQGHSEMNVEIKLVITKRGANTIKPLETISYSARMLNQAFSRIDGLFGTLDFSNSDDTLVIDFFNNPNQGSFTLADPRVKIVLANSTGVSLTATIPQFDGINRNGNLVSLTGFPSPIPLPLLNFSEVGLTKKDSFELNKTTSNLADYTNNRPAKTAYKIELRSTTTGQRHWLLDTSKVAARIEVELPLNGTARDFALEESQPFSLNLENLSSIKEVLFRIYTENGFPIDVATQVYFEDSVSNTILDSLITTDPLILPSAAIDAQGKVTNPNPKTTDIILRAANIANLENSNRIRIRATLNTPFYGGATQPDVAFYSSYNLLLQFGIQAEVLIEQRLGQ